MNWVRKTRLEKGISQYKLARLIGVTNQELSAWENDKIDVPPSHKENLEAFFQTFDANSEEHSHLFKKKTPTRSYSLVGSSSKKASNRKVFDIQQDTPNSYKVISLFAGVGGLSLGFKKAGFDVVGHVEIEDSAREIYRKNFPDSEELGKDIKELNKKDFEAWKKKFGKVHVVVGGPPCQGFSLAGKRDVYDPRNELFQDFARVVEVLQPEVVMLENVRLLLSMRTPEGGWVKDALIEVFKDIGYEMECKSINAADYGVPQSRERVIFLGHKIGSPTLTHPKPTHGEDDGMFNSLQPHRTFRDATGDLEDLESGERSLGDVWHTAPKHPDHVIKMLKDTPEGMSAHDNPDPSLRPSSGYNTTYKRLRWDEPSSTISTNFSMISGSRNVHPKNTRALTIREAMRCQTFPDSFKLSGTLGDIRKGIGNAVPPALGKLFAKEIQTYLNQTQGSL